MNRSQNISILVRLLAIIALSVLLVILVSQQALLFTPLVVGILLAAAVWELIHHIDKTNRNLTRFLFSLRQGAFTDTTPVEQGAGQEMLTTTLNEVSREFAKVNLEKELHYQFLQALNENIAIAILTFDEGGKLLMINPAAKRLLQNTQLAKMEDLAAIDQKLYHAVRENAPDRRDVIRVFVEDESFHLSVLTKDIVLQGKKIRIALLQNLNPELEHKETEAWQQLTRVLTHEIMNSVTPIVSLTDALQRIVKNPDGSPKDMSALEPEDAQDVHSSLSTIAARSRGLLNFVSSYKEFAKTPELKFARTEITGIVERVISLFKPDLEKAHIDLSLHAPEGTFEAIADESMIEQVLVNLVKNSIECCPHDGTGLIRVSIRRDGDVTSITISDNGPGIDADTLSKIFIPFFTTKTKGTGIGLSLSRQIMKYHRGTIRVQSEPGHGSSFTISW